MGPLSMLAEAHVGSLVTSYLRDHKFLVAMLALVAAEVGLYFFFVVAKTEEIELARNDLEKTMGQLSYTRGHRTIKNEAWMTFLESRKERYEKAYMETKEVFRSRDEKFESFWADLPRPVGGMPDRAMFHARRVEETEKLVRELEEAKGGTQRGKFFATNDGFGRMVAPKNDQETILQMKRFWMLQAVQRSMMAAPVTSCSRVFFPKLAVDTRRKTHDLLPLELEVKISFSGLGTLLSNLQRQEGVMFQIKRLDVNKIEVLDFALKREPFRNLNNFNNRPGNVDVPEPPVEALIHIEALDFRFGD
ncbi:hypothetical protein JYT83_01390 [bacterium AH-315-F18]|nr:hypothetical protein [bacterium AH-315-F18]